MKDSYSFDRDEAGLEESYQLHIKAYDAIFDRSGLEWYRVEADVGMMGGSGAHEYMAPCAAGENDVALSDSGYAANVEVASGEAAARRRAARAPLDAPEPVETPGATTIEAVAGMLGVPAGALIKALPVIVDGRGPVLVLVRGDHRLNEIKLQNALGAPARPAEAEEVRERFGTEPGYIGPVGARVDVLADEALRGLRGLVTGANEPDLHLRGVEPGPRLRARPGPTCAASRRATAARTAARSASSRRSRSPTSSSSARATPSRSARATSTSRARSSRS